MYFKPNKNGIPFYLVLAFFGIVFTVFVGFFLLTSPNDFPIFINKGGENVNSNYLTNNEKGDFFGGITNPLIAFIGVIVTGLAFYMQYKANQIVLQQISIQKKTDEITRFETKFYELLQYHNQNVKNLEFKFKDSHIKKNIKGKKVIDYFIHEVNNLFTTLCNVTNFDNQSSLDRFKSSYYFMFYGIDNPNINKRFDEIDRTKHFSKPEEIYNEFSLPIIYCSNTNVFLKYIVPGDGYFNDDGNFIDTNEEITISVVQKYTKSGYMNEISSYLRHLFYIVKFVCKNELLTYEQKREYIRIIRSQLSSNEQLLIYYNWLSGVGNEWESTNHNNRPNDSENYFLTNYRIIHNINPDDVIQQDGISLESVFNDDFTNFLVEKNKINDEYLFDNNLIKSNN